MMNYKLQLYLCLFGGFLGLHKFYQKEYKKGLLYLLTFGGLMVLWLRDCIKLIPSEKNIAKWELEKKLIDKENERIFKMDNEGIAYCPKCKSAAIQYVERRKQLSVGRAIAGSVINPLAGAVGAVTSSKYKGTVKCLKCGNDWKI